jgi:hypothetical protein
MTSPQPHRRTALAAGLLFIATFVFSIAGLLLYGPVLDDPNYVLGGGHDTRVALGAFCEIVLVIANAGTAVVLFPVLRRRYEAPALGYVASRVLESTVIVVGKASVLAVLMLRQDGAVAGADGSSMLASAQALVAVHDATFLLGPAFCAGFGTGILLGFMMYKTGLVPRRMAMIGLVGGPLALLTATFVLFGLYEQTSGISFLLTFPEMVWEASLGIYLTVKGFRTAAPAVGTRPATASVPVPAVA